MKQCGVKLLHANKLIHGSTINKRKYVHEAKIYAAFTSTSVTITNQEVPREAKTSKTKVDIVE